MKNKIMKLLKKYEVEDLEWSIYRDKYDALCSDLVDLFEDMNKCQDDNIDSIIKETISEISNEKKRYYAIDPYTNKILGESDERNTLCGFGKETCIIDRIEEEERNRVAKEMGRGNKRNGMHGIIEINMNENKDGNI